MSNTEKTLIAFLTGAAAGAITGILLAPDNGKRTRKKVNKAVNDFAYDVEDTWENSADRVKEVADNAISEIDKYSKKFNEMTNFKK